MEDHEHKTDGSPCPCNPKVIQVPRIRTFPLKLSDEQHKYIQDKAYELRMSMHKWILLRIELKEQPTPSKEASYYTKSQALEDAIKEQEEESL